MRLLRKTRCVTALFALFCVLFMQLAVAAYACPGMTGKQAASMNTHHMMPGCQGMDMEQPNLCHAHDQIDNQSLDKPAVPDIQPFVPATLLLAVSATGTGQARTVF